MEKLIVNFNRKPKSLKNKKRVVSLLERRGSRYKWEKKKKPSTNWCVKCGSIAYNNDDCDVCIRSNVGEVFYE